MVFPLLGSDQPSPSVLGSVVTACAALGGALLAVFMQAYLERLRWPKMRDDALVVDLRLSVHQFSLKLSSAAHSMCWLTWLASNSPASIDKKQVTNYNKELHTLLPEVAGFLTAVAALDHTMFGRLEPLAREAYSLDAEIAKAGFKAISGIPDAINDLAGCHEKAVTFANSLGARIAGIVSEVIHARAARVHEENRFLP